MYNMLVIFIKLYTDKGPKGAQSIHFQRYLERKTFSIFGLQLVQYSFKFKTLRNLLGILKSVALTNMAKVAKKSIQLFYDVVSPYSWIGFEVTVFHL